MNYKGRNGQYCEIPEEVLKVLFDKDGNKRLKNDMLLFSDEEIAENENIYDEAINILTQFDAEFAKIRKIRPSLTAKMLHDKTLNGKKVCNVLSIGMCGMLWEVLDGCRIPLREARRIYGIEPAVYDDSSIMGFLKNHYDSDTTVIIRDSSDDIIVDNPLSDLSANIEQALFEYEYKKYFDNGYKNKSVTIYGKRRRAAKDQELWRLLFEELYSLNK